PDAKCRDKFLVQSVLVTADKEFTNVGSLVRKESIAWRMKLRAFVVVAHRANLQVIDPREED
ncbi:hypothetical protein NQU36_26340, partial [Escherichia coli]|uniref:hypothetical protein n=1 Tax=Escherichia coli TaxID=562 RepID=UPI002117ACFE